MGTGSVAYSCLTICLSLVCGYLVVGESLSPRQMVGSALALVALVLVVD